MKIPGHVLANKMGHFVHMHTQYGLYRPFGASIIMANWDELRGYSLYMIEPSGQTLVWKIELRHIMDVQWGRESSSPGQK